MDIEAISSLSCGASFFRGDLHIHSFGASHDVTDANATSENIVDVAVAENLQIISITDHNEIDNVGTAIAQGDSKGILVIPGVELSTPEGHLLCYAPSLDALARVFNRLSIAGRRTKECRCQTGMAECLNILEGEGGFAILAHVELPGAFEANVPRFTPAKHDILCHRALLGFEVTKVECPILYRDTDADADRRGTAAKRISTLGLGSQQFLARVLNSDAHTLNAIGRNAQRNQRITRYKMEAPSFDGLRIALTEADTRVRIEDEVPTAVPIIAGVHFSGGFLDDQAIRFSPNLTCIIGGRGSGKSTAFEGVRLLGNYGPPPQGSVIDSDVWPDMMTLAYRDETQALHVLGRGKGAGMENLDDPVLGSTSFPVETYRQGETNEISKRVQEDPMTLLVFLDRLLSVEQDIAEEDGLRRQLNELVPKIQEAKGIVIKIPDLEKELTLKQGQVERLKKDKGEEIIRLQQKLEGEKRARNAVESELVKLQSAITTDALVAITGAIRESVSGAAIEVGAPEVTAILADTTTYETQVAGSTTALKQVTATYTSAVRAQIASWKAKETQTATAVEAKKQELLSHGIRLDMPFIQNLVAAEARVAESLKNSRIWVPELTRLQASHTELLKQRWAGRRKVTSGRTAFAVRASAALKGTLSDLFVTLKFEENSLCPDGERLIIEVMGWRTLQQLKAGVLIRRLTLPVLLECVYRKDTRPILALKNDANQSVFGQSEADVLLERLKADDLLAQLQTVAVHDMPRLSVTKKVETPDGATQFVPRDFKRLSLGQQQSVLLALMLTSESRAPLIVDQPEDNLDSEFIYKTLVPVIRAAKERRQVIVVTHNANIAVLGDAEQIVVLKATHEKATIMERGSIDEPATREAACGILEGSREAFERRARIYGVR
jgi:energy-coupling factor transporter ATP-binding protein EcfA2